MVQEMFSNHNTNNNIIKRGEKIYCVQSNASLARYPNNKPNNFRVRFPEPIELPGGEWVVALLEIHFPAKFISHKTVLEKSAEEEEEEEESPENLTMLPLSTNDNGAGEHKRKRGDHGDEEDERSSKQFRKDEEDE